MASLLLLPFIAVSTLLSIASAASNGGFRVDLIHRDSLQSPYYDPSLTPTDRLRAAVQRSAARANYFRLSRSSIGIDSFTTPVVPNGFEYLMTISLGTPPFEVLAIPDTGSDLIWTQCLPCTKCYQQIPPKFDPENSTTYRDVSCSTQACQYLGPSGSCDDDNVCSYQYRYGDQSYSYGTIGSDTVTFGSARSRPVSLKNIVVGCAHESAGSFDKHGGGLVGLGGGPLSLVRQISDAIDGKFSYCLVPYTEVKASSTLNFGVVPSGRGVVSTPIIPSDPDTFYSLFLESVSVGNETIPIGGSSGGGGSGTPNIIIDSGTTLTYIPSGPYNDLTNALTSAIPLRKTRDPARTFGLCFLTSAPSDESKLPDIVFQFSGAELTLPPLNTFVKTSELVSCLAILPSDELGISIFGNIAQQNFHVGYDIINNEVTFSPTDCTKF